MQQLLFIAGLAAVILAIFLLFKSENKKGFAALFVGLACIGAAYITVYFYNKTPVLEKKEYSISISGSKTIGQYLMPILVKSFLETEGFHVFSQTELAEKYQLSASKKDDKINSVIHFEILFSGSVKGFESLKNDKSDVAMSSTLMPEETAAEMGPGFDKSKNKFIIGYDAIRIIAHPSKKEQLNAIKYQDFEKIILGEIKTWDQIFKKYKGEINICVRDTNSGTFKFIEEKYLAAYIPDSLHKPARFEHIDYFEKIAKKVSEDSLSIGLIDYGIDSLLLTDIFTVGIKMNDSLTVFPEENTIENFKYPLSRPLILYTKGDVSKNEILKRFIDFCLSEKAVEHVKKLGFVATKQTKN